MIIFIYKRNTKFVYNIIDFYNPRYYYYIRYIYKENYLQLIN